MAEDWRQILSMNSGLHQGSVVTLVEGGTFCISGRSGDIRAQAQHGYFHRDARYLSNWELLVNGRPLEPLSVVLDESISAKFVARAHPRTGRDDSTIVVYRNRSLATVLSEEIQIHNFAEESASCSVELKVGSDFAHLLSIKSGRNEVTGEISRSSDQESVTYRFFDADSERKLSVEFDESLRFVAPESLVAELTIPANGVHTFHITLTPSLDGDEGAAGESVESQPKQRLLQWRQAVPSISTNHIPLALAIRQGQEDLGILRIFDKDFADKPVIAAGAPWFMTLFGRDSLLTAYMALLVDPQLSIGVLEALARYQGETVDPVTFEEPGKILHEVRTGTAGAFGFDRSRVFYGSADSTPLFVMLMGELRRWGIAPKLVETLLPHVDRALHWIENYGDSDGDGFVEYNQGRPATAAEIALGIRHQGWKDSPDGIRFADGRLAQAPLALAEVQGYVFAAFQARKWFAREAGDFETADKYKAKAKALKAAFNERFWLEERQCFAMALDGDKNPVDAVASNMGHCLWTGIVDDDRAKAVADHLISDQMFNGWGIRTLSSSMSGYNPIGYHTGSVWPHDTAICAAGLARYGFAEHAQKVVMALLDTAVAFGGRLPELFGGMPRDFLSTPVNYPTSCSPQAWAAASPLLGLRTLLRFDPSIPQGRLSVNPILPPEITHLRLERIPLNGQRIAVEVDGDDVFVEGLDEDIAVAGRATRA